MASSSGSETSKKSTRSKKSIRLDPECFSPPGKNFRGKLIGVEDVPEARGDKMCQVAMAKLKAAVRTIGDHKQRIVVNVSLDGIKIVDERTEEPLHRHPVQRISFIARDVSDNRAFGYVYASSEGRHLFYGIKTEKVADNVVVCLRDLFQVVFEMKKREADASKQIYQIDGSLATRSIQLNARMSPFAPCVISQPIDPLIQNSQSSSNCGSAVSDGDDCSLPSDCLFRLEGGSDGADQSLDQVSAFQPPLSTSPGGTSLPVTGLWDSTTSPSVDEKYNTLPAGSSSIYRSMFMSGAGPVSRSPLAARAGSLRLEQQPRSLELQNEPTYIQTTSTSLASGTLPRTTRTRNRSLTSNYQRQHSANDTDHFAIPPPASVPSTRRATGPCSGIISPSTTQAVIPVTSTGWAKFDLSPLAENAQDIPQCPVPQAATAAEEKAPFPCGDFQPENTQVEHRSPSSGFADFPSPDIQKDNDSRGAQMSGEELSKEDQFADSFVANSFSFDDSFRPPDGPTAAATATLDLMSPSSDRDSISLPSPEAPPPPLPANILASLPLEPPVPPPRPKARLTGLHDRSGSLTSFVDGSSLEAPQAPASSAVQSSNERTVDPVVRLINSALSYRDGNIFPFEFPSDDSAPPPPPRPALNRATMDGYRSLPRPTLSRGISMPCASKVSRVSSSSVTAAPLPTTLTDAVSAIPMVGVTSERVSSRLSAARKLQRNHTTSSPVTTDVNIVETTVCSLPRPRPQLRTAELDIKDAGTVIDHSGKPFDSPTLSSSTPWVLQECGYVEPAVVDPFVNVDPFAVSMTPDDPFGETLIDGFLEDLSNNFDSASLSAQTFRTRAVTVDSVSSDNFDGDFGHGAEGLRLKSTGSRSSDHSLNKPVASRKPTPQSDVGLLIDLNAFQSERDIRRTADMDPSAVADLSSKPFVAQFVDSFSLFGKSETEMNGSSWITFPGPGEPISKDESGGSQFCVTSASVPSCDAPLSTDVVDVFNINHLKISASQTTSSKQTLSTNVQMVNLFPVDDSFA